MPQNPIPVEEFITRSLITHNNFYIYRDIQYTTLSNKVNIICPQHGAFTQRASTHMRGQGCPECKGRIIRFKSFVALANDRHNNKFRYIESTYINSSTHMTVICPLHGPFTQTPKVHLKSKHSCPQCKINATKMTKDEFILKANSVHKHKYSYKNVIYSKSSEGVNITCLEHGDFIQSPSTHLNGHGCPRCKGFNKRNDDFILEAQNIHGDRYDYTKVEYTTAQSKVNIICPEHGSFIQAAYSHLNGRGCPTCNSVKLSQEEFLNRASHVHSNKYSYKNVIYTGINEKVEIICPDHGTFHQRASAHISGQGCPKCKVSKGEMRISQWLSDQNIEYTQQHRFTGLTRFSFDFFLPQHNIAIEYDGQQHYDAVNFFGGEEGLISRQRNDRIKSLHCISNKIKLLRIPYFERDIEFILDCAIRFPV